MITEDEYNALQEKQKRQKTKVKTVSRIGIKGTLSMNFQELGYKNSRIYIPGGSLGPVYELSKGHFLFTAGVQAAFVNTARRYMMALVDTGGNDFETRYTGYLRNIYVQAPVTLGYIIKGFRMYAGPMLSMKLWENYRWDYTPDGLVAQDMNSYSTVATGTVLLRDYTFHRKEKISWDMAFTTGLGYELLVGRDAVVFDIAYTHFGQDGGKHRLVNAGITYLF